MTVSRLYNDEPRLGAAHLTTITIMLTMVTVTTMTMSTMTIGTPLTNDLISMFLLWSPLPRQEKVSFHENWRCIEAETCFVSFELLTKDQLTRVLPGDLLCGAEEEPLESLLEVLVEGDVDDGVDHGVGVGQHVDPEGVPGELVVGGEDGMGH